MEKVFVLSKINYIIFCRETVTKFNIFSKLTLSEPTGTVNIASLKQISSL